MPESPDNLTGQTSTNVLPLKSSASRIVTQSADMRALIGTASRVARSSASVMLTGESGTGKELFAQLIHDASRRSENAFVSVNCASLPTNLIESELFGHRKGAFTDAVEDRVGRFELARGGTLLLDEITEIPLVTQAKLLRVLEAGEIQRVGCSESIRTDVRIVATSNRNLKEEVSKGTFRLDLYHRLNVIQLNIPSLKSRTVDIPLLATHFVNQFSFENEISIQGFTNAAMRKLTDYDWPGNVRELRNAVHRACIMSERPLIDVGSLGELVDETETVAANSFPEQWLQTKLADIEKQIILAAIQRFGNNRIVAEKLGISTRTLTNKLKLYRETEFSEPDNRIGIDRQEKAA
jgi:DNA-binding NtrC family response regulator